jgi:hypothetical protein
MPLSEEELRLLEQMERALVADDPKLASTMRGTTLRAVARRHALLAAVAFVVGVVVLMTGAITKTPIVGVVGFLVMLGSAYVALSSWRGQSRVGEQATAAPSAPAPTPFSVIQGGRRKKSPRAPRAPRARSKRPRTSGSMMERFEERWRRRRGQGGF